MARWRIRYGAGIAAALMALVPGSAPAQTGEVPAAAKPSFFEGLFRGTGSSPAPGPVNPGAAEEPRPSEPIVGVPPPDPGPPPSLAQAEWIGFTPVLVAGPAEGPGAWIAGPFQRPGANGWVTDTVSGLTVPVRLVWREAAPGELARLSAEAAAALGLGPGAVANVAIYVAP